MYEIDEQQIRQWWKIFKQPNRLAEIRLLANGRSYSGYFKDVDTLITQIKPYLIPENEKYYGKLQVYCIFNDIKEELYGREQKDKFIKGTSATKDNDMVRRNFVLIDLDPKRISGISASEEEFQRAHRKAVDVYKYLLENGFSEPIIAISGNGYHLYCPCDLPSDEESHKLVNNFLKALGKLFTDEYVDVDQTVGNVANLTKMIGTWAKKGADGEDRKWRLARFVKIPNEIKVNDISLFQKIADLAPKEEPKQAPTKRARRNVNSTFDLREWLKDFAISYKEQQEGTTTKFILEHCPWESAHSSQGKWDAAVFLDADGSIKFHCFHSHCKDKTWFDFRTFYEPDAYNKPAYQPQQVVYVQQPKPQKPKYEIKEELPELGEKWMSMSSIEKIDLTKLGGVRTGYDEIDRNIVQLNWGEVTLLSGGNASGKSSWLNSLLLNIIQQGTHSALWSGELPNPILKNWIQTVAAGKDNLRQSQYKQGKFYVPDNIAEKIDKWLDGKFFLYNNEYGCQWEQIFHDMGELLKANVKVFILDNLFSLNIDLLEGDRNNKQKELILQIKDFAKKNQVHIILVAHPRKTMAFLRKNDIAGTSDLTNAVDNVFIMHRVNNDFFRAGAEFFGQGEIQRFQSFGNVLEISKNRMYGVVDLMVGMHYEMESRRFKNTIEETIHYGWEEEPTQMDIVFTQPQPQSTFTDDNPLGAPMDNVAPF